MPYADITTDDRNAVKRWLQRRRLDDAFRKVLPALPHSWRGTVLDYGGGDGALCGRVVEKRPSAQIECFEPSPTIRGEAETRLAGTSVTVTGSLDSERRYDLVFCCELLEHLPGAEVHRSLETLGALLDPRGTLVIGVPNEIFAMAAAKGLFRMTRRYGEYDAKPSTVLAATLGQPRGDRPVREFDGLPFIYPHTGFDHRDLVALVRSAGFTVRDIYGSPFVRLPVVFNSEVYAVCGIGPAP
ncbi:MAG: methyltransferase domain-containing protein [Acidimicrobiia bacterium]